MIVIGRACLDAADDVVRRAIATVLANRRAIFPAFVEGIRPLGEAELPEAQQALLRFQATNIDNGGWQATMSGLIRELEAVIRNAESRRAARQAPEAVATR